MSSKRGRTEWESTMAGLAQMTTTALSNPRGGRVKKTRAKRQVKQTRFDKGELGYNGMSYTAMCRVDRLEESYDIVLSGLGDVEDDDDDEFDELDDGKKKKKKKKKFAKNSTPNVKRDKIHSLSQTLAQNLEEGGLGSLAAGYVMSAAPPPSEVKPTRPQVHYCSVTGHRAKYTDPQTGIRYSNQGALESLREKAPPWISNLGGGGCEYYDALVGARNRLEELRGPPSGT
ncbi:hypothetical protein TrCOL_g6448 [Triparma columacea]|jgi:hypothetical protein|uniref:Vps72/YL1 C-terminal domain-containing protein n=1 Tax=Triparma columacea TaxID=722753 RepID=A0A9W7FZW9_9STRA|nr:hypothetical protein TrCOL_g6448 [Triparma columacea]